jgi:hypothetical protein
MVVLTDEGSRAELVPERGALVTRFTVEGEPILFLDESTLADPTKNVRGGIPVLFPSPGVLPGGAYTVDGREVTMRRHGFARDLPWEVRTQETRRVVLALGHSEQTLREFPWRFEALLTVTLVGSLRDDARPPAGPGGGGGPAGQALGVPGGDWQPAQGRALPDAAARRGLQRARHRAAALPHGRGHRRADAGGRSPCPSWASSSGCGANFPLPPGRDRDEGIAHMM